MIVYSYLHNLCCVLECRRKGECNANSIYTFLILVSMSKYFLESLFGATVCQKLINFRPQLSTESFILRDLNCFINYFSFGLQTVCSCYSWAAHASLAKAVLAIDRPALCENMLSEKCGEQPGLIGAQGSS